MDFIKNKTLRLIACVMMAIAVIILAINGVSPDTISELAAKVIACLGVVLELIGKIIEIAEKEPNK